MLQREIPQTIRLARTSIYVHIALHLLVPIIMQVQRDAFVQQWSRMQAGASASQVNAAVSILLISGLLYHLILSVLFLVSAFIMTKGRYWGRITASVITVLGMMGTAFSFSSPTPTPLIYKTLNILSWGLALVTLGLLWFPLDSRRFFARKQPAATYLDA